MAPYDHDHPVGEGGNAGPRCPICNAPAIAHLKPFCAKRCADIDLHRWLAGVYRVPTKEKPEKDEDESK